VHPAPSPPTQRRRSPASRLALLAGLALYALAHVHFGELLITQTNNSDQAILGEDQKHNIRLALEARADHQPDWSEGLTEPLRRWFPHRTDGVVNPLWPWVASRLADPTWEVSPPGVVSGSDRAFFDRGRRFHVRQTLGFLLALGLFTSLALRWSTPSSLLLVSLGGMGALLDRSAYFQPEPLFYQLFFLTWAAALAVIYKNSLWRYALLGLFAGLAYLAKGAVTPLLGVFVAITSLQFVRSLLPAHTGRPHAWRARNHIVGMIFLAGTFALTAGPRLKEAAIRFGDPLHSYPKYWMWMEDFPQGYAWMEQHHDAATLRAIPPEERPSASLFLRQHGLAHSLQRLREGTAHRLSSFFAPKLTTRFKKGLPDPRPWKRPLEPRGLFLLALAGLAAATTTTALAFCRERPPLARARSRPARALARRLAAIPLPSPTQLGAIPPRLRRHAPLGPEPLALAAFVLACFALYTLAFGFYFPISRSGDRFMLSLYLPLVFSCLATTEALRPLLASWPTTPPKILRAIPIALWCLVAATALRMAEIVIWPTFAP